MVVALDGREKEQQHKAPKDVDPDTNRDVALREAGPSHKIDSILSQESSLPLEVMDRSCSPIFVAMELGQEERLVSQNDHQINERKSVGVNTEGTPSSIAQKNDDQDDEDDDDDQAEISYVLGLKSEVERMRQEIEEKEVTIRDLLMRSEKRKLKYQERVARLRFVFASFRFSCSSHDVCLSLLRSNQRQNSSCTDYSDLISPRLTHHSYSPHLILSDVYRDHVERENRKWQQLFQTTNLRMRVMVQEELSGHRDHPRQQRPPPHHHHRLMPHHP